MEDADVLAHINQLAEEERALEESHVGKGALAEDDHARLKQIEIALDQCWDLLAQRRARREAGLDPNAARARPEAVVEHYQQ